MQWRSRAGGILSTRPVLVLLTNFLNTLLHYNLHSHFIHPSLTSSNNSHDYSYHVVFLKPGSSPLLPNPRKNVDVGERRTIVSRPFMYTWATHELSMYHFDHRVMLWECLLHYSWLIPELLALVHSPNGTICILSRTQISLNLRRLVV